MSSTERRRFASPSTTPCSARIDIGSLWVETPCPTPADDESLSDVPFLRALFPTAPTRCTTVVRVSSARQRMKVITRDTTFHPLILTNCGFFPARRSAFPECLRVTRSNTPCSPEAYPQHPRRRSRLLTPTSIAGEDPESPLRGPPRRVQVLGDAETSHSPTARVSSSQSPHGTAASHAVDYVAQTRAAAAGARAFAALGFHRSAISLSITSSKRGVSPIAVPRHARLEWSVRVDRVGGCCDILRHGANDRYTFASVRRHVALSRILSRRIGSLFFAGYRRMRATRVA